MTRYRRQEEKKLRDRWKEKQKQEVKNSLKTTNSRKGDKKREIAQETRAITKHAGTKQPMLEIEKTYRKQVWK